MSKVESLHCSFCDKERRDVLKLIAGPRDIYICDECIAICNEILNEDNIFPNPPGHPGLGPGMRKYEIADEHAQSIRVLIAVGEYKSAARLVRNAALTAMSGVLEFAGEPYRDFIHKATMSLIRESPDRTGYETYGPYEIGISNAVLHTYPDLRRALQETDKSQVILRRSIHGAAMSRDDIELAFQALRELVADLKQRIDAEIAKAKNASAPTKGAPQ